MTDRNAGIFVLKVDVLASGTQLRVGRSPADLSRIEDISIGDEVYDPIEERLVEVTEIACVTLDRDTIRDRGFSPKLLAGGSLNASLVYAVKVPVLLARNGYTPPIRGEFSLDDSMVFYALGFERRTIVETTAALCEFARPSVHAFESTSRRSPTVLQGEAALRAW
jgi:hypothetical protein